MVLVKVTKKYFGNAVTSDFESLQRAIAKQL